MSGRTPAAQAALHGSPRTRATLGGALGPLTDASAAGDADAPRRRERVRRLLTTRRVATQEELRRLLADEGIQVTQATLSRDLTRLGARRVPRAGGTAYELGEGPSAAGPDPLSEVREMVLAVHDNGALVVITTQPGAASAVARAIDLGRLPGCLGSVAGDDTIFVAPQKSRAAAALGRLLRSRLLSLSGRPRSTPRALHSR